MSTEEKNVASALYLGMACRAAKRSPDPSTKNGAVLVVDTSFYDRPTVCADCNRFSVLDPNCQRHESMRGPRVDALIADRDLKLAWIEHAERNAIFSAIRDGLDVRGSTLYCPFAACDNCARAIVLTGVKRLVRMPRSVIPWPDSWAKSIMLADEILRDGGVEVEDYVGPKLGYNYLVNKQEWSV